MCQSLSSIAKEELREYAGIAYQASLKLDKDFS